jgi:hypothetical protein
MQKKVCRITLLTAGPACGRTRYGARVQARDRVIIQNANDARRQGADVIHDL